MNSLNCKYSDVTSIEGHHCKIEMIHTMVMYLHSSDLTINKAKFNSLSNVKLCEQLILNYDEFLEEYSSWVDL